MQLPLRPHFSFFISTCTSRSQHTGIIQEFGEASQGAAEEMSGLLTGITLHLMAAFVKQG